MSPAWQEYLTQHNAIIDAGIVQHFGNPSVELEAAAHNNVLCDLSQFGTVRISGEDAQSFLQNLLSNDIREVGSARAQYSSLNSAKGRMLANMLIWKQGDDYLLQLPRALCEAIRKRLSMYVLRSKVKVSDASDEIILLGLSGANAQEMVRTQFDDVPKTQLGVVINTQGSAIRINDTCYQINTSAQYAPALWEVLRSHAHVAGSTVWDWLNIRSGIPFILPLTQEHFVAQMVNLDQIGGINFKKGCYPGQEIVARTQYLGKLKRRMYLAHMDSPDAPQAGDELFSADMEGQASGMIVNAVPAPGGGYDLLAVVQTSSRESQALHHNSLEGPALQFLVMPYALPDLRQ